MTDALKQRLRALAADDFRLPPGPDAFALAVEMLDSVGSPDSELRDDLIYAAFASWIARQALFSPAQLRRLLDAALDDEHLFFQISAAGGDSVFTRSFSALLLSLLLYAHRQRPYLTAGELREVKERLLRYLALEQDLRGYIPGLGWAHAAAHAADALDELALCAEMGAADMREMLSAAAQVMSAPGRPFVHEEDERMATAVLSALERGLLSGEEVEGWLLGFAQRWQQAPRAPENFLHLNSKNFLRSLYFRMQRRGARESYLSAASAALEQMSRFR